MLFFYNNFQIIFLLQIFYSYLTHTLPKIIYLNALKVCMDFEIVEANIMHGTADCRTT